VDFELENFGSRIVCNRQINIFSGVANSFEKKCVMFDNCEVLVSMITEENNSCSS